MTLWEVILIGLSLSMDAFAVSVADGMMLGDINCGRSDRLDGFDTRSLPQAARYSTTDTPQQMRAGVLGNRVSPKLHILRKCYALIIALTFGVFQAVMPMAGYALVVLCGRLGQAAYDALHRYGHWVAMTLLCLLGGKMIVEGMRTRSPHPQETATAKLTPITLLAQGVATSIDALAVGISLGAVGGGIVRPALVIGAVTTLICLPAVYLGRRAERLLGWWATAAGGAVLVVIGVKMGVAPF